VKVTIMFRGREQSHPERGRDLLMRLAEDVKEIGQIESPPLQDGRNMVMVLGPNKSVGQAAQAQEQQAAVAEPEAAAEQPPPQEPETEAQAEVGAAQGAQAENQ
jgi:translation initiation factor IF-3